MSYDGKISISVDGTTAKSGAAEIKKSLKGVKDQADKTQKATKELSGSFGLLKGAMAGIIGLSFGSFVRGAINTTKDFESAVSELSAITGATGNDLRFLSNSARELGEVTTLSATQAATAFKLIASAKPDLLSNAEALKSVTKEAITLAEAAGIELPEAADALGSSLNQFGAEAKEASRYINVLAAGSKFGASSIADLSIALKNSGTTASTAGISFEETNAALQTLSTVAVKGGEAGTKFRNIILKLQKTGEYELNPTLHGISGALKNLAERSYNATELMKLFGIENYDAAVALMTNVDSMSELTKKLTNTNVAYEQAATQVNNLKGDQKKLNSAWEETQLILGGKLTPGVRTLTQELTYLLSALNDSYRVMFGDDLKQEYADLESRWITLSDSLRTSRTWLQSNAFAMGTLDAAVIQTSKSYREQAAELKRIESRMETIDGQLGRNTKVTNENSAAVIENTAAKEGNIDVLTEASESYTDLLAELTEETNLLSKSAKAQFIYNKAKKLDADAKPEEIANAKKLAGILFDKQKALKDLLATEREIAKQNEAVIEAEWNQIVAVDEYIESLEEQLRILEFTGAEKEIQIELSRRNVSAMSEEGKEIRRLITEIYNKKSALEKDKKAAEEYTASLGKNTNAFEVTWNKTIERLDNGFAGLWKGFVNGSIDAMDFVKETAYSFLAEMLHAFTTKKIIASFGISASGAASAGGVSSGGGLIPGSSGNGVNPGSMITVMKEGLMGTGMNASITEGVNSLSQALGGSNTLASGTQGMMGTNIGMMGTGLIAGFLGDKIFGGYGGMGATTGAYIGSAFGPIGTLIGGILGGFVGGVLGKKGDDTPDLSVGTSKTGDFYATDKFQYQAEDVMSTVGSRFGAVTYLTKHDAFETRESAEGFNTALATSIKSLDDSIAAAVGEETALAIEEAMKGFSARNTAEDPSDFEGALKRFLTNRFGVIMDTIGGRMNQVYDQMTADGVGFEESITRISASFAGLTGYVETDLTTAFENFQEQQELASRTLYESYNDNLIAIGAAGERFDWSIESLEEMSRLIVNNREMELGLLYQIDTISKALSVQADNAIEKMTLSTLDEQGTYDYLAKKSYGNWEELQTTEDPLRIGELTSALLTDIPRLFEMMPEEDQKANLATWTKIITDVEGFAQDGLTRTEKAIKDMSDSIAATIDGAMKLPADTQLEAANTQLLAANTPQQINVTYTYEPATETNF